MTGAASGIGRAVATRFVAEGAQVVFADRDLPDTRRAVAELLAELPAGLSGNATAVEMDVTDELDLEVWRRTIGVNLTGTFLTVKHAVRAMTAADDAHSASNTRGSNTRGSNAGGSNAGGSIICTGSPTGLNGEGRDFTACSTSRAGVHGLVRTVAAAYAYAHEGIRVNTVVPGYTETPLVTAIFGDAASRAAIVGRTPLGRAGTPADMEGSWPTWPATKPPWPRERSSASTVG